MLTRFSKVGVVVICLLLVAVSLASAAATYPSSQAGMRDGNANWLTAPILVNAQGGSGTCTTQSGTAFYQWDLTAISDGSTINTASIAIPLTSSSIPVASDMTLYATTADTWPPTVGLLGDELSTVSLASGATTVTFPTSTALVNYVKTALTDNTANFGIRWSACNGNSVVLNAQLNSTAQLTIDSTTAVTLSTLRTAGPAVNWPLIAGLGVLAAVVIGGLAVSRRRAAAR
jgi:hypothetical protein